MSIKNYLAIWNKFPRLSLLCVTVPLLVFNGDHQSLMAYDEGYYANQARWIWETGDWLTPQWWGTPVFDRTIGVQWLIALAYHLFGVNEFSTRLPTTLACFGSVLLTYEIGKILFNCQIAWLGGLMLMFMGLWITEAHLATQNILLVAIELLGILGILKVSDLSTSKIVAWRWGIIAGISLGLGFMIKGFMIAVPVVALLPYAIKHYHRILTNRGIYLGLIIGALPTVGWLALSCQKYGIMPIADLLHKILFLSKTDIYNDSPFYYLWNLPANIFPWALFSLIGAYIYIRKLLPDINYSVISMTLGYPIVLFILLSLFRTRMPYYTIQLLPFMSLFAATAFIKFTQISRQLSPQWYRLVTWLSYAFSGLGLILVIAAIIILTNQQIGGITIPPEIQVYAIPALMLGGGWMTIIILWNRWKSPSIPYWLAAWFIPAWVAIFAFGLQGTWTNKNPIFINTIQQPEIQQILINKPINLLVDARLSYESKDSAAQITIEKNLAKERSRILETVIDTAEDSALKENNSRYRSLDHDELKTLILIGFYTPNVGKKISKFSDLPDRAYAWTLKIFPEVADKTHIIGKIDSWKLIQKISPKS